MSLFFLKFLIGKYEDELYNQKLTVEQADN